MPYQPGICVVHSIGGGSPQHTTLLQLMIVMQDQTGRHRHIQTRRSSTKLWDPHKTIASLHLLLVQSLPFVAHEECRGLVEGGDVFQRDGLGMDLDANQLDAVLFQKVETVLPRWEPFDVKPLCFHGFVQLYRNIGAGDGEIKGRLSDHQYLRDIKGCCFEE